MDDLHTAFTLLLAVITGVSVVRWREAERKLNALTPMTDCDFELSRIVTPDGKMRSTVIIYKRKGIPSVSDMTGKSVEELADLFDKAEKNGKKCIFEEFTELKS